MPTDSDRQPLPPWLGPCRAQVMLTCLVLLPLAAVTGRSPAGLLRLLVDNVVEVAHLAERSPRTDGGSPLAAEGRLAAKGRLAADGHTARAAPRWDAQSPPPAERRAERRGAVGPPLPPPPTGRIAATPSHAAQRAPERAPPDKAAVVAHIERRLREMGASYYLLEKWGDQEGLYRFQCKMAMGENPDYCRYFEATDSEPAAAMHQVLRQVEAWRADRLLR